MTTITIDIPDMQTEEVISQLKMLGVKIRESNLDILDKLTKEDYQKDFEQRAKNNRKNFLKHL
jgi:hypothetical protein